MKGSPFESRGWEPQKTVQGVIQWIPPPPASFDGKKPRILFMAGKDGYGYPRRSNVRQLLAHLIGRQGRIAIEFSQTAGIDVVFMQIGNGILDTMFEMVTNPSYTCATVVYAGAEATKNENPDRNKLMADKAREYRVAAIINLVGDEESHADSNMIGKELDIPVFHVWSPEKLLFMSEYEKYSEEVATREKNEGVVVFPIWERKDFEPFEWIWTLPSEDGDGKNGRRVFRLKRRSDRHGIPTFRVDMVAYILAFEVAETVFKRHYCTTREELGKFTVVPLFPNTHKMALHWVMNMFTDGDDIQPLTSHEIRRKGEVVLEQYSDPYVQDWVLYSTYGLLLTLRVDKNIKRCTVS